MHEGWRRRRDYLAMRLLQRLVVPKVPKAGRALVLLPGSALGGDKVLQTDLSWTCPTLSSFSLVTIPAREAWSDEDLSAPHPHSWDIKKTNFRLKSAPHATFVKYSLAGRHKSAPVISVSSMGFLCLFGCSGHSMNERFTWGRDNKYPRGRTLSPTAGHQVAREGGPFILCYAVPILINARGVIRNRFSLLKQVAC